MRPFVFSLLILAAAVTPAISQIESDVIRTSEGNLEIFFIGHGTLMFRFNDLVIHVDPVSREADYAGLPDADLVLVTHQHGDHLDEKAIRQVMKDGTEVVMTAVCSEQVKDLPATVMNNGDKTSFSGIGVEAHPAYNIKHTRSGGTPFHPKGEGNAYVLEFGDTRVLIGGDTENVPELKALDDIRVAFLPMNLPYTMTPEMVADAALAIRPEVLYPYHFGNTDTDKLVALLEDENDIEVRIRNLE